MTISITEQSHSQFSTAIANNLREYQLFLTQPTEKFNKDKYSLALQSLADRKDFFKRGCHELITPEHNTPNKDKITYLSQTLDHLLLTDAKCAYKHFSKTNCAELTAQTRTLLEQLQININQLELKTHSLTKLVDYCANKFITNNIDQHKDFEQTLTDTNAYNTLLQRHCTSPEQKQIINKLFRDTLQNLFIAKLKNEGYTDHYISLGNSQQPIISTDKTTIHFLKPPTGKPIAVKQTKTDLTTEYETMKRFQDTTKNPPHELNTTQQLTQGILIMTYLGPDLHQQLSTNTYTHAQLLTILRKIKCTTDALRSQQQVIPRDLKEENIIVSIENTHPQIHCIDFNVAPLGQPTPRELTPSHCHPNVLEAMVNKSTMPIACQEHTRHQIANIALTMAVASSPVKLQQILYNTHEIRHQLNNRKTFIPGDKHGNSNKIKDIRQEINDQLSKILTQDDLDPDFKSLLEIAITDTSYRKRKHSDIS